jgi:hypothetical protein
MDAMHLSVADCEENGTEWRVSLRYERKLMERGWILGGEGGRKGASGRANSKDKQRKKQIPFGDDNQKDGNKDDNQKDGTQKDS